VLPERSEPRADVRLTAVTPGLADMREPVATFARADSEVIAAATAARLEDPRAEAERVALVREVIHAATDLHAGLRTQTLHALAHYRGSHSAWDVREESRSVYTALDRYSATMRRAAARLRPLLAR
jgi:hypothetical protein